MSLRAKGFMRRNGKMNFHNILLSAIGLFLFLLSFLTYGNTLLSLDKIDHNNSVVCNVFDVLAKDRQVEDEFKKTQSIIYITPNPNMNNLQVSIKKMGFWYYADNLQFIKRSNAGEWSAMLFMNSAEDATMSKYINDDNIIIKLNFRKESQIEFRAKCQ